MDMSSYLGLWQPWPLLPSPRPPFSRARSWHIGGFLFFQYVLVVACAGSVVVASCTMADLVLLGNVEEL